MNNIEVTVIYMDEMRIKIGSMINKILENLLKNPEIVKIQKNLGIKLTSYNVEDIEKLLNELKKNPELYSEIIKKLLMLKMFLVVYHSIMLEIKNLKQEQLKGKNQIKEKVEKYFEKFITKLEDFKMEDFKSFIQENIKEEKEKKVSSEKILSFNF